MKKIRVAINGFGRIGRQAAKIILTSKNIELVAINDLTDPATLAHLFVYDSAYGKSKISAKATKKGILFGRKEIPVFSEMNPEKLPWKKYKVDVVLECTGVFRTAEEASAHLKAGAKKVLISAPSKGDGVKALVMGVNTDKLNKKDLILDNASCTTNCTAPVMKVLHDSFGVEKAMLSTIHSYTADQRLQDAPHKDLRRGRAAAFNIVPTETGAAVATERVIPELQGGFNGLAFRVPTISGSIIDLTVLLKKEVTKEQVNLAFTKAAKKAYKGVIEVTSEPLVSSDIVGNPHSAIVDLSLTCVSGGNMVKIIAWYDNEWGYANRLVEMARLVS